MLDPAASAEAENRPPGAEVAQALLCHRATSRTLAAAAREDDRYAVAVSFGHRMVSAWWDTVVGQRFSIPLREQFESSPAAQLLPQDDALAVKIGRAAAALPPDEGFYQLGLAYIGMIPSRYRSENGIYYTPPSLAKQLLNRCEEAGIDWFSASVVDPACGGGAFLGMVASRVVEALRGLAPEAIVSTVAKRLRGYDIDPFGAWLSQVAVDAALAPFAFASGRRPPVIVSVQDSLRTNSRQRFDLVVGNPPYGRVRLDANDRARFAESLFGHANLYGLFTDMALRKVKRKGVVAYVTPTSFLAGEYFKNLRALLGKTSPPISIDFVTTRRGVFEDVLQETLLAVYRRGEPGGPVTTHAITPRNGTALKIDFAGSVDLPGKPSDPWLLPRTLGQAPLVARLSRMPQRLADWGYSVSTGPLVWNRHKKQLAFAPGPRCVPLIWAEAISINGEFIFRADKRNHAPYFELHEKDDWLRTTRACVLLQRTTAKEQNRRLIAAALPATFLAEHACVVVENHVNMIIPQDDAPTVPTDVLAAFLNSAAADRAFRCIGGSVAVSAFELEALPLPAATTVNDFTGLVRSKNRGLNLEAAFERSYG